MKFKPLEEKDIFDKGIDVGDVYWEDETKIYHAYPTRDYKKPIVTELEGCWEVTIPKKVENVLK